MTIEERLKQVVEILEKRDLRFALAGGMAASIYRAEPRTTVDVDFVLDTPGGSSAIAIEIIREVGLKEFVGRKADFDGGPMFAIKRRSSPEVVVVGRDPNNKVEVGLDFLLTTNPWAEKALKRAQGNQLNFGFGSVPTITVEDLIVAKLIAAQNFKREHDVSDIRSVFSRKQGMDLGYVVSQMSDLGITVPDRVMDGVPVELQRASRRIARRRGIERT